MPGRDAALAGAPPLLLLVAWMVPPPQREVGLAVAAVVSAGGGSKRTPGSSSISCRNLEAHQKDVRAAYHVDRVHHNNRSAEQKRPFVPFKGVRGDDDETIRHYMMTIARESPHWRVCLTGAWSQRQQPRR